MDWLATFAVWVLVWLAVSLVGSVLAGQFIHYGMHKGDDSEDA